MSPTYDEAVRDNRIVLGAIMPVMVLFFRMNAKGSVPGPAQNYRGREAPIRALQNSVEAWERRGVVYRTERDLTALKTGGQWCEVEGVSAVPIPPVRVIVDISGGVFQGAEATVPTEVLVVDCTDAESINAVVPGYTGVHTSDDIWAGIEAAEIMKRLSEAGHLQFSPNGSDQGPYGFEVTTPSSGTISWQED